MMKSPRFASKLQLSRLCRWILTLGVIKLALLLGLILVPTPSSEESVDGRGLLGGLMAMAANPFSTSPAQPQQPRTPAAAPETPPFGLVAQNAPGQSGTMQSPGQSSTAPGATSGMNGTSATSANGASRGPASSTAMPDNGPPAPHISANAAQSSPFAQRLPEYSRPDEATPAAPPPPTVTPYVNRDTSSYKQEELNRRERELLALQQQMQSRLDELKKIEGNVQTMLQEADTSQNDKMRHLIDVYTNMKARQAAEVLENIDERIAVQILTGMRGRQAGEILTYMKAPKAAKLSEALTRTQLPR